MAHRPRLDLNAGYFVEAYAGCIGAIEERAQLLRTTQDHQIRIESRLAADMAARAAQFGETSLGGIVWGCALSCLLRRTLVISLFPQN